MLWLALLITLYWLMLTMIRWRGRICTGQKRFTKHISFFTFCIGSFSRSFCDVNSLVLKLSQCLIVLMAQVTKLPSLPLSVSNKIKIFNFNLISFQDCCATEKPPRPQLLLNSFSPDCVLSR